jgi:flagellar motility protein MotE (MotC chaperone)
LQGSGLQPNALQAVDPGIPAETVMRLSESIKRREAELNQRESDLAGDEARLKFLLDDIQREKQEVGALLGEIEVQLAHSQGLLEEAARQGGSVPGAASVDGESSSAPASQESSEQERKNLRTVAEWLQGMPPEQAAESLRQLCNDGKMDMAVKLLGFFEQRDAAKILAALGDAALVTQLAEKFRDLKEEPVKK